MSLKLKTGPLGAPGKPDPALLEHQLIANWLNNVMSPASRISRRDDLMAFIGHFNVCSLEDIKNIDRSGIIAWRDKLNTRYAVRSVKRKMSTINKCLEHLCDEKVLERNVVQGVERPKLNTTEGVTSAISDRQAKDLLEAPDPETLKGKRDRAILATFLFHALRRSELCKLRVRDMQEREGIRQLRIMGKGSKERYIPVHPLAMIRITEYLVAAGHGNSKDVPLFRPISNNVTGRPGKGLSPNAVYDLVVAYGLKIGIEKGNFSTHSLRATAATNALNNREDIRKVQQWLGHAAVQTTAMYDKRANRPEDSPTFRVRY